MGRLRSIIMKDTLVRFTSIFELLFFLILPVIFTLILGGGAGGRAEAATEDSVVILVVDEDQSPEAAQFLTTLAGTSYVDLERFERATAVNRFDAGEGAALLTIPPIFGAQLLAGEPVEVTLQTLPEDANGILARQATRMAAGEMSDALAIAGASLVEGQARGLSVDLAQEKAYFQASRQQAQALLEQSPNRVVVTQTETALVAADSGYDPAAHASAGQLVTWVFIPLLGASAILTDERVRGTLSRMVTTPTSKLTFLGGTVSSQMLAAIVQMTLLIGFGVYVMKVNWGQSPMALAVLMVAFALSAVAMGISLGTFLKTSGQASGLSIMLGMVMALLGGCWYPLELFPPGVQRLAHLLPTTWAMEGFLDLSLRGYNLVEIWPIVMILLGYAVVFLAVGVWRFRYE